MARGPEGRERNVALLLAAVILMAAAILAPLALRHVHAHDPSPNALAAAESTASSAAASTSPKVPKLTLPPAGSTVLFFGDSYTQGYAAAPLTSGYAYLTAHDFGWKPVVDFGSGSGYLVPGPLGKTYVQRTADLPNIQPQMIVLQGGLNDQNAKPTAATEVGAASQVVDALRARYPGVEIVMFGPVPILPRSPRELLTVDYGLRSLAAKDSIPYVDPIADRWGITQFLIADRTHPNSAGHQYIADQLDAALKRLAGQKTG